MAKKKASKESSEAVFPERCPVCNEVWGEYALGHLREHGLIEPVPLKKTDVVYNDLAIKCCVCNESVRREGSRLDLKIWLHVQQHEDAIASASTMHSLKVLGGE
jgi:hypothetical protein